MFGWRRFGKDLEVVCDVYKSNTELGDQKMFEAVERYAKNNFVAGVLTHATVSLGIWFGLNCIDKIKEKKKCKELKDTDK